MGNALSLYQASHSDNRQSFMTITTITFGL